MSSEILSTRTRILKAACTLLSSSPGVSARMGDIAKGAGVSRQALYLHFPNRTDLFVAATKHLDDEFGIDDVLRPSREARTGAERLNAFIEAWGNYIPKIYGVAKTLMVLQATDAEAAAAWETRMQDMREGCEAAVAALARDGDLKRVLSKRQATDILWTQLSIPVWEALVLSCKWPQERYIAYLKDTARQALTSE